MADCLDDSAFISRANVLGVGVHALNMSSAVTAIGTALAKRRRGYVCLAGVHGIIEAQRDVSLAKHFANALLVLPDGMPTVWMGHAQGFSAMDRVFGPDFMLAVLERYHRSGLSHFLYGGGPGVADQLRVELLRRFPSLKVCGTCTPPFRQLTGDEENTLFDRMGRLMPDIIWVGLSTPKQEKFMARYLPCLNTKLMIGVGAAFDFHTGKLKDSPSWVKRAGLQWVHRLLQEPARLWNRYLVNNPQFIFQAGLQLAGLRRYVLREHVRDSRCHKGLTFSDQA